MVRLAVSLCVALALVHQTSCMRHRAIGRAAVRHRDNVAAAKQARADPSKPVEADRAVVEKEEARRFGGRR